MPTLDHGHDPDNCLRCIWEEAHQRDALRQPPISQRVWWKSGLCAAAVACVIALYAVALTRTWR